MAEPLGKTAGQAALPADRAAGWLLLIAAALVVHALWYDFLSDDAFIAARYARNVAQGQGWVFNHGERVEGYTSFAWVALAAGLNRAGLDAATAVRALSLVCAVGCVVVLFVAGRTADPLGGGAPPWRAAAAPALLACSGSFCCWALGGLEACGYALAILAPFAILGGREWTLARCALAGTACGLCALVRPDGVLVIAAVGGCVIAYSQQRRWPRVGAFVVCAAVLPLAHVLWRRSYYGDWLPNTYYVKVGGGWESYRRGFDYVVAGAADNGGLALWLTPLVAPWFMKTNRWARSVSFVAFVLLAGAIYVGGDGLPMHRFIVPILPLWLLLLTRLLLTLYDARGRGARAVALSIAAFAGASLFFRSAATQQYALYLEHKNEVRDWTEVGKWLAEHAPPDATVACAPIGAIGYYSGLHVYDMLGLTDRHIARKQMPMGAGWAGHEKHDGPYILSRRPTYLLLGNVQVLDHALPANSPYMVRPPSLAVRMREGDIFVPELYANYGPAVVELPNGSFLHYLALVSPAEREAATQPAGSGPGP